LHPLSFQAVSICCWILQEEEHSATASASMLAVMTWYFLPPLRTTPYFLNSRLLKGPGLFVYLTIMELFMVDVDEFFTIQPSSNFWLIAGLSSVYNNGACQDGYRTTVVEIH
jgi:hypothetical protein